MFHLCAVKITYTKSYMYINKILSDLRYSKYLYLNISLCISYTQIRGNINILFYRQNNLIFCSHKEWLDVRRVLDGLIMVCIIICTLCDLVWHLEEGYRSDRNMSLNSNITMKCIFLVCIFLFIKLYKHCPYYIEFCVLLW